MNGLSNLVETYREYSIISTDDQTDSGVQRLQVKVTAGHRGGENTHIEDGPLNF